MTAFVAGRRRAVEAAAAAVVTEPSGEVRSLPLLVRPAGPDVLLRDWLAANRAQVDGWLRLHGAVLFRGFGSADAAALGALMRAAGSDLLDYTERSSPRRSVGERVFTSTEHPAHSEIVLHCENSY